MQVGETDGARDAHKDTELKLIDGLDLFPPERKTNVLWEREKVDLDLRLSLKNK